MYRWHNDMTRPPAHNVIMLSRSRFGAGASYIKRPDAHLFLAPPPSPSPSRRSTSHVVILYSTGRALPHGWTFYLIP